MRQWLGMPCIAMCRSHLLGEHYEHHKFVGAIKKGKNLQGYIDKNCLEPRALKIRHDELAQEMKRRGYKHNSPMEDLFIEHLAYKEHKIDRKTNLKELLNRCPECRSRYFKFSKNNQMEKWPN